MIIFDEKSNMLIQGNYKYSLQDVETPNLYRELFPYDEIPKATFNHRRVPMNMPDEIFITDTTFRDGQQSREPFTVEQITTIFDYLHKLGGPKGIIRQSEFFVYNKKDQEAIYKCLERGYKFPQVTTWIRATEEDFKLVKEIGVLESGILVSCSDYHIFNKLKMTRKQALEHYLGIIETAINWGISPRCHFEDITRADFYGFVVPFAIELRKLMEQTKMPIKIRACDTMGYGLTYPGVALPRSVQGIIYGLNHFAAFPSELIEWHGHNDFYKAVANATTAWLYGAASVNCSMFGIGERTGNTPLEAMIIEYIQLRGTTDGMETTIITEIAKFFEKEIGEKIPPRTPFVGKNFNVTQAGIHTDGLLKDEEIYNIFNTDKILNRPCGIIINKTCGNSGVAHIINSVFDLEVNKIDKRDHLVIKIKEWIDEQYENGRITNIGDDEIFKLVNKFEPEFIKRINKSNK